MQLGINFKLANHFLSGTAIPAWVNQPSPGVLPVVDFDFAKGQYYGSALSSSLSNSSTGNGGYVTNADGTLTYVFGQRTNLCPNSTRISQTAWSVLSAPNVTVNFNTPTYDGSATAYSLATVNGGTAGYYCGLGGSLSVGTTYIFSTYVKLISGTGVVVSVASDSNLFGTGTQQAAMDFNLSTGAVSLLGPGVISSGFTAVGNGWYRVWTVAKCATVGGAAMIAYVRGSPGAEAAFYGCQAEVASYATQTTPSAHIPTTSTAVTVAAPLRIGTGTGLLVEDARTNLLLQSQFTGTWNTSSSTLTTAATTAPDGTLTAASILETATTNFHFVQQLLTKAASSITYVYSCYVKSINGRDVYVQLDNNSAAGADLYVAAATGVTTTTTYGSGFSITALPTQTLANGWFRIACVVTTDTATSLRAIVGPAIAPTTINFAGNTSNGIYVWGAQLEQASDVTSYIPTLASTVTRAADSITGTGVLGAAPTSGTAYMSFTAPVDTGSAAARRYAWAINDGGNNRLCVRAADSGGGIGTNFVVGNGTSNSVKDAQTNFPIGATVKTVAAWDGTSSSFAGNGNLASGGNAWSFYNNAFLIGGNAGLNSLNGYITRFALFTSRLSDTSIQSMSAVSADIDLIFVNYASNPASLPYLTTSRSSTGMAQSLDGSWTSFSSNVPRITNKGLLVEESRTNFVRNSTMVGAGVMADNVEKITNGTFTGTTGSGWTVGTFGGSTGAIDFSVTGQVSITNTTGSGSYIEQQVTGLTIGRNYAFYVQTTGATVQIWVGLTQGGSEYANIGNNTTNVSNKNQFTATSTTAWIRLYRTSTSSNVVVTSVSVQDGDRLVNGNFSMAPLNASQNALQNGWQWRNNAGTGTVTWNGTDTVTLTGDGTNQAQITQSIPTVAGFTYTVSVDVGSNFVGYGIGTTAYNNNVSTGGNIGPGTNIKVQFTATSSLTYITFGRVLGTPTTLKNISVVSAGAIPTNWTLGQNSVSGMLYQVTGTGIESGINYIDIRLSGTPSSTQGVGIQLFTDSGTAIPTTYGTTWTSSIFLKLVSGSWTNTSVKMDTQERNSGGAYITERITTQNNPNSTDALGLQRFVDSITVSSTGAAGIVQGVSLSTITNQAIDVTFRVGLPQLELTAVNSNVTSVTKVSDGTGGINGTAVYNVVGGTGSAQVSLNVTWSAGVLTINSVANQGSYSALPASPATLYYVSGTATGWTGATVNLAPADNSSKGFATSPIPTSAGSVARGADLINVTTGSVLYNRLQNTIGTVFAECQPCLNTSSLIQGIFTSSGRELITVNSSTSANMWNGVQSLTATLGGGTITSSRHRFAAAWDSAGRAIVGNYGTVNTDANTIGTLSGSYSVGSLAGGRFYNGYITEIGYYAQKKPNAALQALTVLTADLDIDFTAYNGNPNGLSSYISCTRTTSSYAQTKDGMLKLFAPNTPRITDLGLLVEGGQTNQILWSQSPGNHAGTWPVNGSPNVTDNVIAAPDGTVTASLFARTNVNSTFITQAISKAASSITYTMSLYAKAGAGRYCALRMQGSYPSRADVVFDLVNGAISTSAGVTSNFSNASASIIPLANGWYRLVLTATSDTSTGLGFFVSCSSNGIVLDLADSFASSSIYIWGMQLEQSASFASSYIPTAATTSNRDQDTVKGTAALLAYYNGVGGTVSMKHYSTPNSVVGGIMAFNDGSGNNRVDMRSNQGGIINAFDSVANATKANVAVGTPTANVLTRSVISFSATKMSLGSSTGSAFNTGAATGLPSASTITQLLIGAIDANTIQLNNYILGFRIWNFQIADGAFTPELAA